MSEWLSDAVSPESCDRVRDGVLRRIRRRWMVRRAIMGLAGILLAGTLFWPKAPEMELLSLAPPSPPKAPEVRLTPPKALRLQPRPAPAILASKATPAERIIILTGDPDVVIILVGGAD